MAPVSEDETVPLLRVVKGEPDAEELAALVAVVASLGSSAATPPRRTPEWNANHRMQRVVRLAGPGAWRASGLPR
jgi:acyl-CoA carboxylase epsilon subunit